MRPDGRAPGELRTIRIKKNFLKYADGSCLIEWGNTKVLCSATLEDKVPPFLKNSGRGWLTAEYAMLPTSCTSRIPREGTKGKQSGRTHEIQRLIGRSLRAVVDFAKLGERTIWIDCDVIQGDGGTRTANITGSFIALGMLLDTYHKKGVLGTSILRDYVAAVSIGIRKNKILIDLCYEEDSTADVDMNIVMTGSEQLIEVQGTAEGKPFSIAELNKLLTVAKKGINQLIQIQKKYVSL